MNTNELDKLIRRGNVRQFNTYDAARDVRDNHSIRPNKLIMTDGQFFYLVTPRHLLKLSKLGLEIVREVKHA